MKYPQSNTLIILFAKEPIPGQVKTRLIPYLGEQGAFDLYSKMFHLQLERFYQFPNCDFSLHLSPSNHSAFAQDLQQKYGINIQAQYGDGLGERMFNSIEKGLKTHRHVILLGADTPFLDQAVMHSVIEGLEKASMVFVPALDGGYMLVATDRIDSEIFRGIDWSTGRVMQQTRERIENMGWEHLELEALPDIDEKEDLVLLERIGI